MTTLKTEIHNIIKSASENPVERQKWLGAEVAHLGLKHHGLDEDPIDSALVLSALFSNDKLDDQDLLKITRTDQSKLNDSISTLIEYKFINECPESGKYQLTEKGQTASRDIYQTVITRKLHELRIELEHVEKLYSRIAEL